MRMSFLSRDEKIKSRESRRPRALTERYTFGITEETVQIAVEQGAGEAAVVPHEH